MSTSLDFKICKIWKQMVFYKLGTSSAAMIILLMLETDYSGLFGKYHACWWPSSLSRQGINMYDINNII